MITLVIQSILLIVKPKLLADSLAPVLFRRNISPADGSVIGSAPAPLRLVMREHPDTKVEKLLVRDQTLQQ